MNLIPAIDLIDGECVRLVRGDYAQKTVYSTDPVARARQFAEQGFRHLHLVDLDGARTGEMQNLPVLEQIAACTELCISFGGGVQSREAVANAFSAGATKVVLGSIAIREPQLFVEWLAEYGAGRIILAADVRDGQIAVSGWQQTSTEPALPFIAKQHANGATQVLCTAIEKDGTLEGPALKLYQDLRSALPEVQLLASGGIASLEQLRALRELGCAGAIIGKALYEGRLTPAEIIADAARC